MAGYTSSKKHPLH